MENHHMTLQPLNILQGYFECLSQKSELKDLQSTKQRVFAEELVVGKITVTLVKAKRVQIPVFHGADLQRRHKVRSIIKAKIDSENNTQDKEELLPGNYYHFYVTLLCFYSFYKR